MADFLARFFYGIAYASNTVYQKAATAVLGFFLGIMGLLWLAAGFDIRFLAVAAMWLGCISISLVFWRPFLGGIFSLAEFISKKDDPTKKSVLRAYLLLIISVVVGGCVAILLGILGAGETLPFWILGLLTIVACAVTVGGARLELWLPRISILIVVMAIGGTFIAIDPLLLARVGVNLKAWETTESEQLAKNIADNNSNIIERRKLKTLDYVERLQNCRLTKKDRIQFNEEQHTAYNTACAEAGGITDEELKKHWDKLHTAWLKSYGRGAFAGTTGERSGDATKDRQHTSGVVAKVQGWGQQYGWPVVIALLVFHIWLLIWGGGKLKEKYLSSDSKEETPAKKSDAKKKDDKKSSGFPTKTVLAIAALGGGAYFWPDLGPVVQNVPAQARQFYERNAPAYAGTRQPRLGVIVPENASLFRASVSYRDPRRRYLLDDRYFLGAGKPGRLELTLGSDSSTEILADAVIADSTVTSSISGKIYVVFVAQEPNPNIVLGGGKWSRCIRRENGLCIAHIGGWQAGSLGGNFRWEWNETGKTAKVTLYEGNDHQNQLIELTVRFAFELQ